MALERRYIKWYGRKDLGSGILRNKTDGGDGNTNMVVTEETKRKRSASLKGHAGWFKGKRHNKDTKRQIGETLTGRPHSEERKRKISEGQKGRVQSEETKRKISEAKKGFPSPYKGKPLSNERRLKLKEAWANRKLRNNNPHS